MEISFFKLFNFYRLMAIAVVVCAIGSSPLSPNSAIRCAEADAEYHIEKMEIVDKYLGTPWSKAAKVGKNKYIVMLHCNVRGKDGKLHVLRYTCIVKKDVEDVNGYVDDWTMMEVSSPLTLIDDRNKSWYD